MYHPPGLQPGFLYHMDLVPDCTMNLFPSEDLLSRWGTRYQSKMKRVWFPTPELMLEIRSFPICAGVTPVGLWFVILLDKLEDFFFFPRDFLPTRVSQAIALTSSGTVWHLNVNALASSSVYLCNSEKENPPGELMTVDVGKLSRHTQPLSVETRFFTHASSTLTDHDK